MHLATKARHLAKKSFMTFSASTFTQTTNGRLSRPHGRNTEIGLGAFSASSSSLTLTSLKGFNGLDAPTIMAIQYLSLQTESCADFTLPQMIFMACLENGARVPCVFLEAAA